MPRKLLISLAIGALLIFVIVSFMQRLNNPVDSKGLLAKIGRNMTQKELRQEIGELRTIVRLLKKNDFMSAKAAKEYGVTPLQFELLMNSWGLDTISTEEIGSIDEKLFKKMEEINNEGKPAP